MLTRRAALSGFAAAGLPLSLPCRAFAQAFPSRTITIVVPYPPGGPIDSLARLIAQEAAADLKQPVWSRTALAPPASSAPAPWRVPNRTATR